MPDVWLNGAFVPEDLANVSVRDLGLLHAAGVFTTMRADGGSIFRLDRHLARVRDSANAFSLALPYDDATLTRAAGELLDRNAAPDARLRLTVTRGTVRHDPLHGAIATPTVLLTAAPLEPYPAELYATGMTVVVDETFKLNPYDPQAGHKTLDYLSRFHALREAQRRGGHEAMLFNVRNALQSGAVSNVFLVRDGRLLTPPTNEELRRPDVRERTPYPRSNVLPGVVRGAVLEAAAEVGVEVEVRGLTITDLLEADEAFVTNSAMRVMPVCRVERRTIGDGRPGAIMGRLREAAGLG